MALGLALVFVCHPAAAQIAGLSCESDTRDLVELVLETLNVRAVHCEERAEDPLLICAGYSRGFSAFKSDMEDLLRRTTIPDELKPLSPWRLDGQAYLRRWHLEECQIDLKLDEKAGLLTVAVSHYIEPDEEPD